MSDDNYKKIKGKRMRLPDGSDIGVANNYHEEAVNGGGFVFKGKNYIFDREDEDGNVILRDSGESVYMGDEDEDAEGNKIKGYHDTGMQTQTPAPSVAGTPKEATVSGSEPSQVNTASQKPQETGEYVPTEAPSVATPRPNSVGERPQEASPTASGPSADNGIAYTPEEMGDGEYIDNKELDKALETKNDDGDFDYDQAEPVDGEDAHEDTATDYMRRMGLIDDKTNDYYEEYMEGAPEYVSEEEQARRLRAMKTKQTITDMGSLASAFANLYYTSKEAPSMDIPVTKAPDYQAYIDKWNGSRDKYRKYASMGKEYAYKRQREEIDRAYEDDMRALKLAYEQSRINLNDAKTTAEQKKEAENAAKIQRDMEEKDRQYQLKVDALNLRRQQEENRARERASALSETVRHHQAMESKSSSRSSSSGGGGSRGTKTYKGGNYNYDIPSNVDQTRMENAIIKDMQERGLIDENKYITGADGKPIRDSKGNKIVDKKKTRAELVAEMHKKWDKRAGDIVRNDYQGSKRGESTATPTPKPAPSTAIYKASDGRTFKTHKEMEDYEAQLKKANEQKTEAPKANTSTEKPKEAPKEEPKKGSPKPASTEKPKDDGMVTTSDGKKHKKFSF